MPRSISKAPRVRFAAVLCAAAVLAATACGRRAEFPQVSEQAVRAEQERQLAFRFETLVEQTRRVQSVAFRIMTANAGSCGRAVAPAFGLSVLSLDNLSEELRPLAAQRLWLDNRVGIVHVVKDSPARRAGLAPGDRILDVAGRKIPEGRDGTRALAQAFNRAMPGQPLQITILRRSRQLTFPLRPVSACALQVMLAGQNEEGAETGGRRIVIPRALLRLAASEEELALVISHELAHIVGGHVKQRGRNGAPDVLGGFSVDSRINAKEAEKSSGLFGRRGSSGSDAFSKDQEKRADKLGMYFMARAGFDTQGVERFWRKVAEEDARAVPFAGVHPASPERLHLIARTHDEIALKRRSQAPLTPKPAPGR